MVTENLTKAARDLASGSVILLFCSITIGIVAGVGIGIAWTVARAIAGINF